MIGRFANPGDYKDLLKNSDFLKAGFAGLLALAGFIVGECDTGYLVISRKQLLSLIVLQNGLLRLF